MTATGAAADSLAEKVRTAREAKGWSRYKLDKIAKSPAATKRIEEDAWMPGPVVLGRIGDALGVELAAPAFVPPPKTAERRPRADGVKPKRRRGLLPHKSGPGATDAGADPPPSRPSVRRVSTSPLTESLLTFAAGGMERIGQGPLGSFTAFTAPVAGEIVDDVVAGTVVDKLVQPLVRGSEKYQNLGALFAGYASIAWATNVPEAAPQAESLFRWSMTTLLPLQGKEMVRRAKEQKKAADALQEIMPDLARMVPPQFAQDPIGGLWAMMWAQQPEQPAPEPDKETAAA